MRRLRPSDLDSRRSGGATVLRYLAGSGVDDMREVTPPDRARLSGMADGCRAQYTVPRVHLHMMRLRRLFEHLEKTDAMLVNPCPGCCCPSCPTACRATC